jgi:hypothetical protein
MGLSVRRPSERATSSTGRRAVGRFERCRAIDDQNEIEDHADERGATE